MEQQWLNLQKLNIPKSKWEKFRKLKLQARVVSRDINGDKFILDRDYHVGRHSSNGLIVVVPKYKPQAYFYRKECEVEILITENDLVKLGCLILSGES